MSRSCAVKAGNISVLSGKLSPFSPRIFSPFRPRAGDAQHSALGGQRFHHRADLAIVNEDAVPHLQVIDDLGDS